jgi:hypothetical protein
MSQLDPSVTVYADIDKVVIRPASGAPVQSVNAQTGVVVLDAGDVGADYAWVYAVPVDGSTYVLPSAVTASERTYVVKAFTQTVTVTATAGLIDGTTSAIITPPNSATFHSDGTNWYII